jgi:hypothetical protein
VQGVNVSKKHHWRQGTTKSKGGGFMFCEELVGSDESLCGFLSWGN